MLTLQNRRALRPVLSLLQERSTLYRWKFPFGIVVHYRGLTVTLQTPKDLPTFFEQLNLPLVPVPDWYHEFKLPRALRDIVGQHPPTLRNALPMAREHDCHNAINQHRNVGTWSKA